MQKNRLDIIFENDDFVAINKPSGMLSIPDRKQSEVSLKDMLIRQYEKIFTVHRLDKGTSGVIIFAKNEETHKTLSQLFEARESEKYYFGLVHGSIPDEAGIIDAPMMEHPSKKGKMMTHAKGKDALTDYAVEERFKLFTWMQFRIHTGRTHQIRVHMQHVDYSIVCDELYGSGEPLKLSSLKRKFNLSKKYYEERPLLARLALHASLLKFVLRDEEFALEAELPKDLRATLQQLRKVNV